MEWISVEDKMPPPMTLVLALVQYDTTPIIAERRTFKGGPEMWWATCPEYGEINGDAFWYGGFEGVGTMVTHWMPLPETRDRSSHGG